MKGWGVSLALSPFLVAIPHVGGPLGLVKKTMTDNGLLVGRSPSR